MSNGNATNRPAPLVIQTPANFPVTWETPADATLFWTRERMLFPDPVTPMDGEFIHDVYAAASVATTLYEFPLRIRSRRINTYVYLATVPVPPVPGKAEAQEPTSQVKLRAVLARFGEIWRVEWLPEVQRHVEYWEHFDLQGAEMPALLSHLDDAVARHYRLQEIHFQIVLPRHLVTSMFDELYRDLFGHENALGAFRLLQGFDNKTLEADRALWALSHQAVASTTVRRNIEDCSAGDAVARLEASPDGRAFLDDLRTYLYEYGRRGAKPYLLSAPGWIEDPSSVFATLKEYVKRADHDPEDEMKALAVERDRLVAAARAHLRGYPPSVVDEFEFLLKAAQEAGIVSEDHNFWIDYRVAYEVRRVILEFGRRFARAGYLDRSDDVMLLTLPELRESATSSVQIDRRRIVAGRRAELEYFRSIQPPAALGTPPSEPPTSPLARAIGKFRGTPPPASTEANILRGHPASAGIIQGPARVIRTLADASSLQRGDVLVAETASTLWTPLFAIAAALVTDTGGILCHCAVVAREYRIPAVVGTGVGTSVIQNGQMLEVDGDHGIVRIV